MTRGIPGGKMHADEVDTDSALVARLLEAQFPHWAALPIEPVASSGTDNALYRVGEELVARLPRVPGAMARLENERRWLPLLAPRLPLDVPLPLGEGQPGEGYPFTWSVYRWLEGEDATIEGAADEAELASDLTGLIAALEEVDPAEGPPPGVHNAFRGVPLAARDAQTRAGIDALRGAIDVDAVTAAWDEAVGAAEESRALWIHGDLDARNLLVTGGRLSAVVDWGCVGVGDPACDVMVAWKVFSREGRAHFRRALAVDDAAWARARGWALSQAVIALAYYTMETNPVLVLEARRWLAEALGD